MSKKTTKPADKITVDGKSYTLIGVDLNDDGRVNEIPVTVREFVADLKSGKYYRDRFCQRTDDQWSRIQKSKLIVSILQNRPIGSILCASGRAEETGDKNYTTFALIDGLQRSTAISEFVNDQFKIHNKQKPIMCRYKSDTGKKIISESVDIAGLKFSQLPEVLRELILNFRLFVYAYTGFENDEIDEIIFSTNNGKSPTSYQRMRFALGLENMRLLQPICDSTFFEDIHGIKPKNDSILCCLLRSLMMISGYYYNSLSTSEIMKFIDSFEDNVSTAVITEVQTLIEELAQIKYDLSDNEIEAFDACSTPHFVMAYQRFKEMRNPDGKNYLEFIQSFITSSEYRKFLDCCQSGSGGAQYSVDSIDNRQSIIEDYMDEFLDYPLPQDDETA